MSAAIGQWPETAAQRHLLVLAYYFPPQNASGAQRPFRFVKHLRRHGYIAHVVTREGEDRTQAWGDVVATRNGSARWSWAEVTTRSLRRLERVLPYKDQLPWAPQAIVAAQAVLARYPVCAVLSTSPPVGAHLAASWLQARYGIGWVADFRDPLCGNPFRNRWWGKPYDEALEGWILARADAVIANTDAAAQMMRRKHPRQAEKIHLLWNGFDPEEAIRPEPIPARAHRVLAHVGSIYEGRHPGTLLAALLRLVEQGAIDAQRFRLRLVGPLDKDASWCEASGFNRLVKEGIVEAVPELVAREQAWRELAQADYLLLLDVNEKGVGVQVPAKLFEYVRVGRPILAFTPAGSPTERILARAGVPYCAIDERTPSEELDRRLLDFLKLPSEPVRPSSWFDQTFNAAAQAGELSTLLHSIVK